MAEQPLRILSLDGGGVRSLSTLRILEAIMRQLARQHATNNPGAPELSPRPCDYFDLICGTSTGGLIALMIGRLRMVTYPSIITKTQSVHDAIDTYKELSESVFGDTRPWDPKVRSDCLGKEIERIIQSPSIQLEDPVPNPCTFVVSTGAGPVRMRSYETDGPSILEAARATMAAPNYFSPITIKGIQYGGRIGCNNPAKEAVLEAQTKWPGRPIGILVSIGTGLEDPLSFNDKSTESVVRCLTSSEPVHQDLIERDDISNYFRFNVQGMSSIGLAEWDKVEDINALTATYLEHGEIKPWIRKIANLLQ